jgi:aldose sugar dehydrogenase
MVVAAFTKNIKAYSSLFSLTTIILVAALLIISTSLTLNGSYYYYFYHSALAVPHSLPPPSSLGPTIVNNETHLKIETVFTGLRSPTSMAFLGPNDILVLEKSQGTVQRILMAICFQNLFSRYLLQPRSKEEC